MQQPAVSFVVITQNRKNDVRRCLASIERQDFLEKEIVLLDGGSADGTVAMVESEFPQVSIIRLASNLGIPAARNRIIESAKGRYCVAIDDDAEFIAPDVAQKVVEFFESKPQCACLSFRILDAQDSIDSKLIPRRDRKVIEGESRAACFVGTGFAVRKKEFIALGGFWEKLGSYFGEEPDLSYRMLESGYEIFQTDTIKVRHHSSPDNRPSGRRIYYGTRNTPLIAIKNLPLYSVFSLTVLAWGYFFMQSLIMLKPHVFLHGVVSALRNIPCALKERRCVTEKTIAQLKEYSGVYVY